MKRVGSKPYLQSAKVFSRCVQWHVTYHFENGNSTHNTLLRLITILRLKTDTKDKGGIIIAISMKTLVKKALDRVRNMENNWTGFDFRAAGIL